MICMGKTRVTVTTLLFYVTLTIDKKINTCNKVVNTRAHKAQNHFIISAWWSV